MAIPGRRTSGVQTAAARNTQRMIDLEAEVARLKNALDAAQRAGVSVEPAQGGLHVNNTPANILERRLEAVRTALRRIAFSHRAADPPSAMELRSMARAVLAQTAEGGDD